MTKRRRRQQRPIETCKHRDKQRNNNPPVGLVTPDTDPARDQSFTISLAPTLDAETIQPLNLTKDDLFICRDIALSDNLATNLALQCQLKTI